MKRIYFFITAMALVFASTAQDNKPEAGKMGVGFGILGGGLGNRIGVSHMLKGGLEPGVAIGFSQSKSVVTTTDSVSIGTNNGTKRGTSTVMTTTKSMSFSIVPSILKHADIASNLDAFCGLQIPIIFNPSITNNTNTKVETTDYVRETDVNSTQPSSHTIGVTVVFGAQWFFQKNLAVGSVCGLGAAFGGSKGNVESTTVTTNSGSANPLTTVLPTSTFSSLTVRETKSMTSGTFNNILGLFLVYYF